MQTLWAVGGAGVVGITIEMGIEEARIQSQRRVGQRAVVSSKMAVKSGAVDGAHVTNVARLELCF